MEKVTNEISPKTSSVDQDWYTTSIYRLLLCVISKVFVIRTQVLTQSSYLELNLILGRVLNAKQISAAQQRMSRAAWTVTSQDDCERGPWAARRETLTATDDRECGVTDSDMPAGIRDSPVIMCCQGGLRNNLYSDASKPDRLSSVLVYLLFTCTTNSITGYGFLIEKLKHRFFVVLMGWVR